LTLDLASIENGGVKLAVDATPSIRMARLVNAAKMLIANMTCIVAQGTAAEAVPANIAASALDPPFVNARPAGIYTLQNGEPIPSLRDCRSYIGDGFHHVHYGFAL